MNVCDGGAICYSEVVDYVISPARTAAEIIRTCPSSPKLHYWIQKAMLDSSFYGDSYGGGAKDWEALADSDVCLSEDPPFQFSRKNYYGKCYLQSSSSCLCDWGKTCAAAVRTCPTHLQTTLVCQVALDQSYSSSLWCANPSSPCSDVAIGKCICNGGLCDRAASFKAALTCAQPSRQTLFCPKVASSDNCSAWKLNYLAESSVCQAVPGDATYLVPLTGISPPCGSSGSAYCPTQGNFASGSVFLNTSSSFKPSPVNTAVLKDTTTCQAGQCVHARRLNAVQPAAQGLEKLAMDETMLNRIAKAKALAPQLKHKIAQFQALNFSAHHRQQVLDLHNQLWLTLGFNLSDLQAPWLNEDHPSIRRVVQEGYKAVAKIRARQAAVPEVEFAEKPAEPKAQEQPQEMTRSDAATLACSTEGSYFIPFGFKGAPVSTEASISACQARCAVVPGCAHFSFYVPKGDCHLHDVLAEATFADASWVAGPPGCSREQISEATHMLLQRIDTCFYQHSMYDPQHSVAEPVAMRSAIQCQQRCQDVQGCAHFSFSPGTGLCHLARHGARRLSTVIFGVAGPRHCSEISLVDKAEVTDEPNVARSRSASATWALAALGLVICMTVVGRMQRRRLPQGYMQWIDFGGVESTEEHDFFLPHA